MASSFPSLVGGTLIHEDFAPSILFSVLFGCLVPLAASRLLNKSSRTTLLIGTISFSVERVVIFSLRAVQSMNQQKANSRSLATYEQLTIGMGYIGICQDLVNFMRVLLVNATRPTNKDPLDTASLDRPKERFWYRRLSGFLSLAFLSAVVPGIISGSNYSQGIDNPDAAKRVMTLRYASAGVALFLTTNIGIIAFIASRKVRGVQARPAAILMTLSTLLSIVAIYRLAVMHNKTDSLLSRGPGSLSSHSAKALFYIFHILPEWLVMTILLGQNTRQIFGTGPLGDWKATDTETSCERRRREKKEREAEGRPQDSLIVLSTK